MKELDLSNSSNKALVDDDIYNLIAHTNWYIDSSGYPN